MIELVDLEEGDRWAVYEWRNSPAVARYMYNPDPIPRDVHDAWFTALVAGSSRQGWKIVMDQTAVGAAFLTHIDRVNERASWAFYLADARTRGKGVGSAVEFLVLEEVFQNLHLHKLSCEVLSFNEAVVSMHKRFGFVEEGLLREHFLRDGAWVDVHLLAMFREDWERQRSHHWDRLCQRGLLRSDDGP